MQQRERLDQALVRRGLYPTRERAQDAIDAGLVRVNGKVGSKASLKVGPEDVIQAEGDPIPYVSRGGLKLQAALDEYQVGVFGLTAVDVGASTGGFTDCLLQRGARRVFAVDVGKAQLAPSLRVDPRVVVMEETDVRGLADLPEAIDIATVDVSFISLTKVLPAVHRLVRPGGSIVALIKPQFEVGPGKVGKGGIVRDPKAHREAVDGVVHAARGLGLSVVGTMPSPVLGTEGNREFLAVFRKPQNES